MYFYFNRIAYSSCDFVNKTKILQMHQEIKKIKELFDSNINVMEYFRNLTDSRINNLETIKISYDLQAGTYIEAYTNNVEFNVLYTQAIASMLEGFGKVHSILEAGVGEATTLANVVEKMKSKPSYVCGFDISWSRVNYACAFARSKNVTDNWLFTGDLFNIPLKDNSVDIVYTSHSIEPNGGREKEAIQELYRIASKYLILLEPAYELASDEAKARMEHHGYVRGLKATAEQLGYKVVEYRLFDYTINPLNPTGLLIIEKDAAAAPVMPQFVCPITGGLLKRSGDCFYGNESLMAYPIIGGIPCLLAENGILASGFNKPITL
jgi:SAM-dependent methyltransferase